jgi:DNA repair ATPase RecN
MTKNNIDILKAKKELLERQISILYDELDEIAEEMNSKQFYAADGIDSWRDTRRELNNLYKKAEPLHEIREYLQDVLNNIEQTDLDEHLEKEGVEDEWE